MHVLSLFGGGIGWLKDISRLQNKSILKAHNLNYWAILLDMILNHLNEYIQGISTSQAFNKIQVMPCSIFVIKDLKILGLLMKRVKLDN